MAGKWDSGQLPESLERYYESAPYFYSLGSFCGGDGRDIFLARSLGGEKTSLWFFPSIVLFIVSEKSFVSDVLSWTGRSCSFSFGFSCVLLIGKQLMWLPLLSLLESRPSSCEY